MKKLIVSGIVVLSAFASVASAQSYYAPAQGSCTTLTRNLSVGSHGSDVSALQSFLVAQNYPGGGSWMITGTYGAATQAAVGNFQTTHGLPKTGQVDASTRAAINQASCGMGSTSGALTSGSIYTSGVANNWNPYLSSNPFTGTIAGALLYPNMFNNLGTYPYGYNNYNGYPYDHSYYNNTCNSLLYYGGCTYATPHLDSINPNYGTTGTQVTLYGSNFDPSTNTIYVGGTTLNNIPSPDGHILTFTMPNVAGDVSISVAGSNSSGTSNALTFHAYGSSVCNGWNGSGTYGWNSWNNGYNSGSCGCGTGYTYCPSSNSNVSIAYLSPSNGGVGTAVTVYGWGFTSNNNTVRFGNGIIAGLRSDDGRSVSFTIPAELSGYGYQPIGLGSYNVSVTNGNGEVSNAVPFTITSTNNNGSTLSITNVSGPNALNVNQQGTWSITVNQSSNVNLSTSVNWGDNNSSPNIWAQTSSSAYNNTLSFTHAYQSSGTYTITFTVTDSQGHSNTSTATVSVSGNQNNGSVSFYSISPSYGSTGTQVVLHGSGFTQYDNTVHFGNGGTMHVSAQDPNTIYYTIPYQISPCDVNTGNNYCAQYIQQVTSGSYPMYITNSNGTSQTLNFQVQ